MWFDEMVDSVEAWLAGQSYFVQVPLVLAVLIPVLYLLAGLIDRVVERALRGHTRREDRLSAGREET